MAKKPYSITRQYSDYRFWAGIAKNNMLAAHREEANYQRRAQVCSQRNEELQRFMSYIESVMSERFTVIYYAMKQELFTNWIKYGNKPIPQANQQIETFLHNSTRDDAEEALRVWQAAYIEYQKS